MDMDQSYIIVPEGVDVGDHQVVHLRMLEVVSMERGGSRVIQYGEFVGHKPVLEFVRAGIRRQDRAVPVWHVEVEVAAK